MKLKLNCLSNALNIDNGLNILAIENSSILYKVCEEMSIGTDVNNYVTLFDEGFNPIYSYDFDFVSDLFSLSFNNRKNQIALNKALNKQILGSPFEINLNVHTEQFLKEVKSFIFNFDIPLEINEEIVPLDILKVANIRIKEEYSSFVDKLSKYIRIVKTLRKINIFIFLNASQFLTVNEINSLNKDLRYNEITVIFLENHINENKIIKNKSFIIDENLDLLY